MTSHPRPRRHLLALAALLAGGAHAFEIDTGSEDWSVRWDTGVRLSTKVRTEAADPALRDSFRQLVPGVAASAFPQALNFNAGDQNFQKRGIVSERLDLLTELDAIWRQDFGVRLSAAAWYDAKLHGRTRADNDATIGQTPHNEFPARTRRLSGRDGEVLDAFVFGGWPLDGGAKVTTRLGRHALQYGESLFFGDNGVARAQGPIDIDKLLASPNAQFKEIVRPVPQLSAQWQLSPTLSLGGYLQFQWESDRLPSAGSYFSSANIPWGSSQSERVGISDATTHAVLTNYLLAAGEDQRPSDSGQFGMQLKWRLDESDLGFYVARYHDKGGQLYGRLATLPGAQADSGGQWFYVFPEAIKVAGASFSTSLGDFNLAGEASVRDGMPLHIVSNHLYGFYPGQARPRHATGRTAHLNLSTLATFGPGLLAQESTLVAELAWNRLLSVDDPDRTITAGHGRTRDATALQLVYTPSYRQALPGVDLSVPVGLRYTLDGASSVTAWDARGNGMLTLGLEGNVANTWQFAVTYTHYLGDAVPFVDYRPAASGGQPIFGRGNALADRDHLALSLRRTF
ncbi:uncharacterized protein DUF1302 [Sphaerotilus hippei]|uniref:Uncharacterized protein DUF1302 n=1 Tax=Sphaerotilus hippei TaxID=744406 RepID=A0A318H2I4_9BURK|nr:DUF1302 family protein [Sphaerotilus hippei]PXW97540.1 uncharacterized protein DUF1302 [Sphaerotilus hippei]